MIMDFSVRNLDVTVVGAARSGLAAVDLLQSHGARVTLAEMAPHLPETVSADALRSRGVRVELGPHTIGQFTRAHLLVVSPGVPLEQPALAEARSAGVPIIGELELAARWVRGRVIAITGTKGKSTTTTLASRMLTEAGLDAPAVGNIGSPWCARVDASTPATVSVVEASSFQLESIDTFHPWIAVLLNLSPDHLDRHPSVEAYAAAKSRIFLNQTQSDWAVVNADDPSALALAKGARAQRFDFSLDGTLAEGVTVEAGVIVRRAGGLSAPLLPLGAVNLPGRHLLSDVLAAAAVACLAGVPPEAMHRAVSGFHGLPHALERVGVIDGITYVNDSKATNIASAHRAIESFKRGVVVILGGRYKGGQFEDLREVVADKCVAVVAIGEAKGLVRAALAGVVPVHDAESMGEAVRQGRALAPAGGTVLLAPACSSFDMFVDYQARGRAFAEEVRRMSDGQSSAQAPR
jgi:UDP-N-acetylmuramoylalanine--D-glutamate ligase